MENDKKSGLYVKPDFATVNVGKDIVTMSGDDPFMSDGYDLGGNQL